MRAYLAALGAVGLLVTACGGGSPHPAPTKTFHAGTSGATGNQLTDVKWNPAAASGQPVKTGTCRLWAPGGSTGGHAKPDPRCTPGLSTADVTNATAKTTTCSAPWAAKRRPDPAALQRAQARVLAEYGLTAKAQDYDVQFLVAPRLGGAFDLRNLWPVLKGSATATQKAAVDQKLAQAICSGHGGVQAAQFFLRKDWTTALQQMGIH